MRVLGRLRLVAAGREVGGEHIEKRRVRLGGEQRAEFPFHERLHPRVVAQQVEQPAQAQVSQPVERGPVRAALGTPAVRAFRRHVGHLAGLKKRAAYVPDGSGRGADPDHQSVGGGADPLADPRRQTNQDAIRVGSRAEREHGPGAGVVQRSDQGWNPLGAAGGGRRVGDVEHPRVSGHAKCPRAGRIAQPEHHGDEPAAVNRDPERPGSHRGLGRVGVGLADDAADQRAVSLPVQAFQVSGEQAAERQRGGGPLDEHGVRAARRAVADQDHAAPVLAPRADWGEEPPRGLVVDRPPGSAGSAGSARSAERAAAPGEAVQQPRGIGAARLAGQHPVRQVGQDHRPAGQDRGLPNDLVRRRSRHGEFGEGLVQTFRRAQFLKLRVDDPGVHRLGDLDERNLALEGDQRQPAVGRGADQGRRQGPDVPAAQLHREGAHPGPTHRARSAA